MKKFYFIIYALLCSAVFNSVALKAQNFTKLTLNDIWASAAFYPEFPDEMFPLIDGEHYCVFNDEGILMYDYKKGEKVKTLVDKSALRDPDTRQLLDIDDFIVSNDGKYILISTETEYIYRYSNKSDNFVYNIASGNLERLTNEGKQQLAMFSPDGNKIAFVRENNLYIKDLSIGSGIPVTNDGNPGFIINGITDWVYEEEFDLKTGFLWSPNSEYIAYYKFDESKVKEYSFIKYEDYYPTVFKYKYPMAGEDNSVVSLWVYEVKSGKTIEIKTDNYNDCYIPRIYWSANSEVFAFMRMNRHQNILELLFADVKTGESKVVWTEKNKYYIDITDNTCFSPDNDFFITTSERDGYNHIWKFTFDGDKAEQITQGKWDVTAINGVDWDNGVIYYSSHEPSPLDIGVYKIKIKGNGKSLISKQFGHTEPEFSSKYDYFISTWSDVNTPPLVNVCDNNGKIIRNVVGNSALVERIDKYGFTKTEFFTIKTSDNEKLNACMIKPPDFSVSVKYPVLFYVYGGPGSQTVENNWGYFNYVWFQMLAQKGYIVVSVDCRGTGGKGEEFKKCTYLQLGKYETEDVLEAAKYIASQSYADENRLGIWGWSFGGYLTASCMTSGDEIFKTGIAVAPVIDWRLYDNIYTERFMLTPAENLENYNKTSVLNRASKLKGKLLLVHGTADDNVHVQNTLEFAGALTEYNKQFEMQLYTNKNHSIYGGYTRLHLYERMTNFILQNL